MRTEPRNEWDAIVRGVQALERIADALEQFQPAEAVCEHPADQRDDYSAMGRERWRCKLCGHEVGMGEVRA